MLLGRAVLVAFGFFFVAVSLFVYEDEDRKIQSLVENLWITLDEYKRRSIAAQPLLITRLSVLMSMVLDGLLGSKLISTRSVVISIALSLGSFLNIVLLLGLRTVFRSDLALYRWILGFFILWTVGMLVVTRIRPRTGACCLTLSAIVATYLVFVRKHSPGSLDTKYFFMTGGLALVFSVTTDFIVLATVRHFLREVSYPRVISRRRAFLIWMKILGLLVSACLGPSLIILCIGFFNKGALLRTIAQGFGVAALAMNISDLLLVASLCVVFLLLIAHHSFWPVLERPIYAIQKAGWLNSKKLLLGFGIVMMVSGLGLKQAWVVSLLDVFKKVAGL